MLSMKTLVQEFLFDCQVRNLSPRTIHNYEKQLNYFMRYLKEAQGVEALEDLKPLHIKQFVVMLQGKKNKPSYVNDLLKAVKCLCAYAFDEGYTPELLTKKVKNVKEPKVLIHTFSDDEIVRMIQFYDEDCYFLSKNGRRLTPEAVNKFMKKASKSVGVNPLVRVSPHTCRHTFAHQELKNGLDLYSLSLLLGHESVSITQRYLEAVRDVQVLTSAKKTGVLAHL